MTAEILMVNAMVFVAVGTIAWATRAAYVHWRKNFTQTAKLSLEDMFVFVDPGSLFHANVAVFILLPALAWLLSGSPVLAVFAAALGAFFPRLLWVTMRKRRMAKLVTQLPDGLTMMAGALKAGAGLNNALDMVVKEIGSPLSQEFSMLLREQRLGLALEDSLRGLAQRVPSEEVDLFVSALAISKEVGGNLSEVLDRLASTLRAKAAMEGKIKALTSQGKLQGLIVAMLPLFLAGILYVMDPASMLPLFTTLYGWGVMAAVFLMLALGGVFIRKIVTIDV